MAPEAGDVLIGIVVDVAERTGFAGDRYPVLTVRTEEGDELAVHAFHTVLKDELARLEPKIGKHWASPTAGRLRRAMRGIA